MNTLFIFQGYFLNIFIFLNFNFFLKNIFNVIIFRTNLLYHFQLLFNLSKFIIISFNQFIKISFSNKILIKIFIFLITTFVFFNYQNKFKLKYCRKELNIGCWNFHLCLQSCVIIYHKFLKIVNNNLLKKT